jgi:hypothetical protein
MPGGSFCPALTNAQASGLKSGSMKVTGSTSAPKTGAAAPTRPSAGGFTLPNLDAAAETAAPARAASLGGVSSVQALIALQEMGGPLERRKKAMERGGRLLDVLDQIKVALLDGELDGGALDRLTRAIREERSQTDEPALEDLLNEIETRAAVEQAKLQMSHAA